MQPPRESFFGASAPVPTSQWKFKGCSLPDLRSKPALRRVCPLTKTRGGGTWNIVGTKISRKRTPRRLPRFWHFIHISYSFLTHLITLTYFNIDFPACHDMKWANTLELTLDKQDALQTMSFWSWSAIVPMANHEYNESLNDFVPGHILIYFAGIFQ